MLRSRQTFQRQRHHLPVLTHQKTLQALLTIPPPVPSPLDPHATLNLDPPAAQKEGLHLPRNLDLRLRCFCATKIGFIPDALCLRT
jgi:hypothetical protein